MNNWEAKASQITRKSICTSPAVCIIYNLFLPIVWHFTQQTHLRISPGSLGRPKFYERCPWDMLLGLCRMILKRSIWDLTGIIIGNVHETFLGQPSNYCQKQKYLLSKKYFRDFRKRCFKRVKNVVYSVFLCSFPITFIKRFSTLFCPLMCKK